MKIREIYEKHKEVILYLVFGVLTTAVSWVSYFLLMYVGKAVLSVPASDVTSARYLAVYTASQVISWMAAVLFAFFSNRKWVFTESNTCASLPRQLVIFASGRLLTLLLDMVITYVGTLLLGMVLPKLVFGLNPSEVTAKLVAAVVVVVLNYVFSKLFVFKGGK